MTRINGKMEGGEYDSLESVLDEIPDQVAWMSSYDEDEVNRHLQAERLWMGSDDVVVVPEGGSGTSGGCSGNLYSFLPHSGNEFLTQFGGYASSGGSSGSQMFVGGGDLCPKSVSMPGSGGLYDDGRGMRSGVLSDEEELCKYLNRMGVRDDDYVTEGRYKDVDFIGFRFPDDQYASLTNGVYDYGDQSRNGCSGYGVAAGVSQNGYSSCGGGMLMSPALPGFQKSHVSDNLFPYQTYPRGSGPSFPPFGYSLLPVEGQVPYPYRQQVSQPNLSDSFSGISRPESLYYVPNSRMNVNGGDGILEAPNLQPLMMHQRPILNMSCEQQCRLSPNIFPTPLNSRMPQSGLQDINREGSFILQGQGMRPVSNRNMDCLRRQVKDFINGSEGTMPKGKHTHRVRTSKISGTNERRQNQHISSPGVIPQKLRSISEVFGPIPDVAKHQTQCRLLQDIIEDRNPQSIQAIFDEIIEHVVELMINPFGNYFIQKLLDVCSEEQRTKIIEVAAKEPGVLVRISMNDHGTRVVQKLIETAKTREQILKMVSALEPGFYALITDSNGNHVIERCLHCFTNEQNKFIFAAAIKYCIEIATDQYGCCVLQKCISHSTGVYRDHLVAEISNNTFLLSQDAFGNYAVQFILDLKNPTYTSRLISQLRGNYVHLAMQKCSSHVVEKCLKVFNSRNKSQLIHELLSFNRFEQLLQDPHANYVIQTALKVSEGAIHQRLVHKIELYRSISRHSPYSKRIFASKKNK